MTKPSDVVDSLERERLQRNSRLTAEDRLALDLQQVIALLYAAITADKQAGTWGDR